MSQIFRKEPPFAILNDMLQRFADKEREKYIVDYVTFKRILFHNFHYKWLLELREYYYKNKCFYVTRKFTFSSFVNIVRQLCKIFNVNYTYSYDRNQNYHHLKYTLEL